MTPIPSTTDQGEYVIVDLPEDHDWVFIDRPENAPQTYSYVERIYTYYVNCREVHLLYRAYEAANPIALGRVIFRNTVIPLARLSGFQRVVDGAQVLSDGAAFVAEPLRFTTGRLLYFGAERISQTALTHFHPEVQGTIRVIIRANRDTIQSAPMYYPL